MQQNTRPARCRRHAADDLGRDGRVRRDYVGRQSRLGRREAAELPQAQADLVRHAGRRQPAAARRAAARQRDQRRRGALVCGGCRRARRSSRCCSTSPIRWASTVVFIMVVGLIFYFVPNAKVRFRDVWVGAVVTGLLWRGALAGFSWYVSDLDAVQQRPRIDRRASSCSWSGSTSPPCCCCTASKSPPPTRGCGATGPTRSLPRRRRECDGAKRQACSENWLRPLRQSR